MSHKEHFKHTCRGQSSESSQTPEEEPDIDKQSVLQVPVKEMTRGSKQNRLEDLSTRQLGYVLAGLGDLVLPSDLLEIGGQSDSGLQPCCCAECASDRLQVELECLQSIQGAALDGDSCPPEEAEEQAGALLGT